MTKAFSNKSALAQAGVLAAGPLANLVIAFVLFSAALMVGIPSVVESDNAQNVRNVRVVVAQVLPESPAAEAGLKEGDELVSFSLGGNIVPIEKPEDFINAVSGSLTGTTLTVRQSGEEKTVSLVAKKGLIPEEPDRAVVGLAPALIGTLSLPFGEAVVTGLQETFSGTKQVALGIGSLIVSALSFSADLSGIAGPVGIAGLVGNASAFGVGAVLSFAALISINLAVINFLPFPALDGGRILFVAIETLIRKRIPILVANTLNFAGFALLVILMLVVTVNDIARLVS